MASIVVAELKVDDQTAQGIGSAKKNLRGFEGATRSTGASIASTVTAMSTAYLAVADVVGRVASVVGGFSRAALEAAGEAERAEAARYQAIGRTSAALDEQAAALQRVSMFEDDAVIKAQAAIGAFTRNETQIRQLTQATADLAQATGMDLVAAAELVAKSFGSPTNALSRYGIEARGAAGSTERLTQLTQGIANLYGGQAAAAANTFQGRLVGLRNAYGDQLEVIGGAVTKNDDFRKALATLTTTINNATPALGALANNLSIVIGRWAVDVASFADNWVRGINLIAGVDTRTDIQKTEAQIAHLTSRLAELKARQQELGEQSSWQKLWTGEDPARAIQATEENLARFQASLAEMRARENAGAGRDEEAAVRAQRLQDEQDNLEMIAAANFMHKEKMRQEALINAEMIQAQDLLLAQQRADAELEQVRRSEEAKSEVVANAEMARQNMQMSTVNNLVGLLNQLGQKNKAAAMLGIAITKGMEIARTYTAGITASMLAYASQIIPGDPTSLIRATAAAAKVKALTAVNIGLIAASGFAQAASLGSGGDAGGGAGGGGSVPASATSAPQPVSAQKMTEVTVIVQGNVLGDDNFVRSIADAVKRAAGDGVDYGFVRAGA